MLIDPNQVRRHIKFNMDENEGVRDRRTLQWHALYKGTRSCHFHKSQLLKLFGEKCFVS